MVGRILFILIGLLTATAVKAEEDGRYQLPSGGFGVLAQGAPQARPSLQLVEEQRFGRFEDTVALRAGWFVDVARVTGRLDIETAKRDGDQALAFACTATAISADLILTNAHCVKHSGPEQAVRLHFYPEYRDARLETSEVTYAVGLTPVEWGEGQLDYAIYRLDRPLAGYAALKLSYRDVVVGEPLVIIGHPEAQPLKLSRGGCQSDPEFPKKNAQIVHSCATRQGSSGSLVFGLDGSLVGLHHLGGAKIGGRDVGYAVSMVALVEESPTLARVLSDSIASPEALQVAQQTDMLGAEGLCFLGVEKKQRIQDAAPIIGNFARHRLYVDIQDDAVRFLTIHRTRNGSRDVNWGRRGQVYGKDTMYTSSGQETDDFPTPMHGPIPGEYAKFVASAKVHRMVPMVAAIHSETGEEYWAGLTLVNSASRELVFEALKNSIFPAVQTCIPVQNISYLVDTDEGVEMTVAEYLEQVSVSSGNRIPEKDL